MFVVTFNHRTRYILIVNSTINWGTLHEAHSHQLFLKTYPFSILQYGIETVKYNDLTVFQADDQLRRLLICLDPANSNEGLQFSEFQEKFSVWVESEQRFVLILDIVLTVKFSLNSPTHLQNTGFKLHAQVG